MVLLSVLDARQASPCLKEQIVFNPSTIPWEDKADSTERPSGYILLTAEQ